MAKSGIHRSTPNSKAGRQMNRVGVDVDMSKIPKEIVEWNEKIEAQKKAKHEAKLAAVITAMHGAFAGDVAIGYIDQEKKQ